MPHSFQRDWAAMTRLPNAPTVWSNVFTGWVIAGGVFAGHAFGRFGLTLLGGTLFYAGGALFSEVWDVEFDREHRSERPLPSGRVKRPIAAVVSCALMAAGAALFSLAGAPIQVVATLVLCIVLYAFIHKAAAVPGIVLMGLCRALLGWAAALAAMESAHDARYWTIALWAVVAAISWLARGESRAGAGGIVAPLILWMLAPLAGALVAFSFFRANWGALAGFALWTVVCAWAVRPLRESGSSTARKATVGRMLAALPVVDALFLLVAGFGAWALVPLGCAAAAKIMQRIASAT